VIAQGVSQSATRLAGYVNAVQPLERVLDAVLLQLYFGTASKPELGGAVVNLADGSYEARRAQLARGSNLLRTDSGARLMVVNSEREAQSTANVRQPDSDVLRWWEAAGTAHAARASQEARAARLRRDGVRPLALAEGMNELSLTPLFDAALHHVHRWVHGGPPPPSQPRLEVEGDPAVAVRDAHGVALGGIRLPEVEVPLARHTSEMLADDALSWLRGASTPFPAGALRARYGDAATYLARFDEACRAAEAAGVLLPRDAAASRERARQAVARTELPA
jgi:hypothetical protein